MAQFHFRKFEKWLKTLENYGFRAKLRFRCESRTARAQVEVEAYPFDSVDLYDPEPTQLPPLDFTIHAIDPKWLETRFDGLDILTIDDPITFRTEVPALWSYESRAEIFCNSPVNFETLFRNVARRMHGFATREDIFRYLDPLKQRKSPFWLGGFPASLFRHVRDELQEMNVAIFIPAEPKVVEMPVLLEIGDVLSIIAQDFEIDIPEFETFDAWFGKR